MSHLDNNYSVILKKTEISYLLIATSRKPNVSCKFRLLEYK